MPLQSLSCLFFPLRLLSSSMCGSCHVGVVSVLLSFRPFFAQFVSTASPSSSHTSSFFASTHGMSNEKTATSRTTQGWAKYDNRVRRGTTTKKKTENMDELQVQGRSVQDQRKRVGETHGRKEQLVLLDLARRRRTRICESKPISPIQHQHRGTTYRK
jgi:hypothetical protein